MRERMKTMKKILKSLPFQLLLGVIIGIECDRHDQVCIRRTD